MADNDHAQVQVEDFVAALEDIAEAAPELIQYMFTYYPPELMMYISPEICQRLEVLKKSLSPQELIDFFDSSNNSLPQLLQEK